MSQPNTPHHKADVNHLIPYPSGLLRLIFRAPLWLYRWGLGWVLYASPLLVLTTRGRKTGLARHAVLEFRRHGSKYYVVSGWGERPNWFHNLQAHPLVTVQRGNRTFQARATVVTDSAEALLAVYMFRRNSLIYERLLANMSSAERITMRSLAQVASEFTVVRLQPETGAPQLAGVTTTNRWIAPLLVGVLLLLLLGRIRHDGQQTSRVSSTRDSYE